MQSMCLIAATREAAVEHLQEIQFQVQYALPVIVERGTSFESFHARVVLTVVVVHGNRTSHDCVPLQGRRDAAASAGPREP